MLTTRFILHIIVVDWPVTQILHHQTTVHLFASLLCTDLIDMTIAVDEAEDSKNDK